MLSGRFATVDSQTELLARTFASTKSVDTIWMFTGRAYLHSSTSGGNPRWIGLAGHDVIRAQSVAGGLRLLRRSCRVFTDPATGEVLSRRPDEWDWPAVAVRTGELEHSWIDPSNESFGIDGRPFPSASTVGDQLLFIDEIVGSLGTGVRTVMVNAADRSGTASSIPATMSIVHTPIATSGGLVVQQLVGRKLNNGFADLPARLRNLVTTSRPEFAFAPTTWSEPEVESLTG
jgi:hypothetical protein